MRRSRWLVTIGAALAVAALPCVLVPAQAENTQQERMTSCNADAKAKGLKGAERKAFMKSCLSGKEEAKPKLNSQQEKMKSCNADATAKKLKGDDRKKFMSECLKG